MLKSWLIQNFKPILDSGELKLAPVTVLAGRNSSGKSSLLQSILMIAQTVGNQLPERVLLPNERIIQLGTYEDVLSECSETRQMTIGFELETGQEQLESSSLQILANERLDVKSARFITKIKSASSNGLSLPAIEAANVILENTFLELNCFFKPIAEGIRFLSSQEPAIILTLIVRRITDTELDNYLNNVRVQKDLVPYADRQSNYLAEFISDQLSDRGPFLVALSHFLPVRFVGKITFGERFKELWMKLIDALLIKGADIDDLLSGPQSISEVVNIDVSLSENLRNYVERVFIESEIFPHFSGQTLRDLLIWLGDLRSLSTDDREKITGKEFQNLIVQELMSNVLMQQMLDTNILEVINNSNTDIFSRVISEATNFFTSKIRYLGPLRADPSSTQRLFAPTSQLDDVGFKGEYAAVVYQHYQLATISWYSPYTRQIEQDTLREALDSWVRYLDVAHQVRTESAGNIGVAWKVVVKKNLQARTLPEVGVGVSQILPILVMGLLAPSNTLLILEQPELHLHPSVQARLGDFFMGLSKCGKQCLIETHSENLVSQLRYHIVQAGGQENSDCLIYFVDQDDQGAARFNPIEISPQGNILNWPDGFFDETMLQEDRITAASLKKRAKKANNG